MLSLMSNDSSQNEDALRQLLAESRAEIGLAVGRKQEKATAMLFAARVEQICLKGLGGNHDNLFRDDRERQARRRGARRS